MIDRNLSVRDFSAVCLALLRKEKPLMGIILVYGIIASAFNLFLPLSIQYIASQISANASIFPVAVIILCLMAFLIFYGVLKVVQVVAFAYFEKRFFINTVALMALNPIENSEKGQKNYIDSVQSYAEIENIIKSVGNFLFSTSLLIQQIFIGLILTAFYHISFLIFNIALIIIIFSIFKRYFLRSLILCKKEFDSRYKIGNALHSTTENRIATVDKLLFEYTNKKGKYADIILKQNIIFFFLYAIANAIFLTLCSVLTLRGFLTIPQFLASEIIFSLIFMNLGEFAKNLKTLYELLNASHKLNFLTHIVNKNVKSDFSQFNSLKKVAIPKFYAKLLRIIIAFILCVIVGMAFIPWWQTSAGTGKIVAFNQEERIQDITSLVSGRVAKWYINDGQFMKKGEKIAEIVDNDPSLVEKLNFELDSIKAQYASAKNASLTGRLNYDRQKTLYEQGLSSKKELEKVTIEYQKLIGYESEIQAKLIQSDVKLSRQQAQVIVAPHDGFIMQAKSKASSSYVYVGEVIATFVPIIKQPSVEMFVSPNDISLIHIGRKARIQIEGWPALRVSGWPSTSLGTFGAKVAIIEQAMSANGKFRVILVPDPTQDPWPEMNHIKQGTNIKGWISMNKVSIGYEIWRQMNSFPIKPDEFLLKEKQ